MIPVKQLLFVFLVFSSVATYAQFRLYEKGHDHYKAGKYDEAITSLTEYLTKSTRDKAIDIDVFYIRALAHYKLGHFDQAIPDFEETLLRGHANKGNIYWFMAKSYNNLRNDEEAINAYDNAIRELKEQAEPKAKLLYERSEIHERRGNIELAYADLKEGHSANPGNTDINAALKRMEQVASRKTEVHGKTSTSNPTSTKRQETKPVDTKAGKKSEQPEKVVTSSKPKQESADAKADQKPAKVQEVVAAPALSPLAEFYKEEKRFALVIGNSGYPKQIGVLRNPVNDATDIAKELKASHFDVTLLTDATYGQIRAALMRFKEKLDGGDPEKTVGLFYYAGHGLQFDDENYLVPVDALVEYEDDIPRYCFPINRMVLANMERSSTRMNIVILDACRNNPFPSLNRSLGNSGLGEMKRAKGSFIAYATAPGSVASDGTGRNGLYTQELLKAMQKPGLTIEQVFKEVRGNVLKLSNNKQNTWDSSNIIGEFHFKY